MNKTLRIERIPAVLATSYEKATRLAIESYYQQVAEEIVADFEEGALLDLGTGPGYLPVEIAKLSPAITILPALMEKGCARNRWPLQLTAKILQIYVIFKAKENFIKFCSLMELYLNNSR